MGRNNYRLFLSALATTVIVLCLWNEQVPALDPSKALTEFSHDVWQIEDGLPQSTVRAIVQTRDGYLWFGTEEGLARFDGAEIHCLRQNKHEGDGA